VVFVFVRQPQEKLRSRLLTLLTAAIGLATVALRLYLKE